MEPPKERRTRQARKVTDIFTWLQCLGTCVAVLAPCEPQTVPELMAYMSTIVRVSQDYEGLGWVMYNLALRRQAALSGNSKWSVINGTLFTMNFSSRRAAGPRRCELCFATPHNEQECAQSGNSDPDIRERLKSQETAVIAMARLNNPMAKPGQFSSSSPIRRSVPQVEHVGLHLSTQQVPACVQQVWRQPPGGAMWWAWTCPEGIVVSPTEQTLLVDLRDM